MGPWAYRKRASAELRTAKTGWNGMFCSAAALQSFRIKPLSACIVALFAVSTVAAEFPDQRSTLLRNRIDAWYPLRKSSPIPAVQSMYPDGVPRIPSEGVILSPPAPNSVMNCNDSGPGSLREAIGSAASGDMIDLTSLPCSEITLITGEIHVIVDDLALTGPGASQLTIFGGATAAYYNRIFDHTGVGTLSISGVTLTDAHHRGSEAKGGCIYSQGSLTLANAVVMECTAESPPGSNSYAVAGAIYARENVWLIESTISDNVAYSAERGAYGGALLVRGNLECKYSTFANNQAIAPLSFSKGGGLVVFGDGEVVIKGSTISGNAADFSGGLLIGTTGASSFTNSTLSYNYASIYVGGATFMHSTVTVANSTVTRNSAYLANLGVGIYADQSLTVLSSILADNADRASGVMLDVSAPAISGLYNLITAATSPVPAGTTTACPRLTALRDHGGITLTHALIAGSPPVDAGNNSLILDTDQRGGAFPRIFGARADIGAFEWQGDFGDTIFRSAFEIRCD